MILARSVRYGDGHVSLVVRLPDGREAVVLESEAQLGE